MSSYFKSPMNYMGNKYKLLKQLIPLCPKDIDIFVDMFCGINFLMLFKEYHIYTLILLHARMCACIHMDKGHKKMRLDAFACASRRVKGFVKTNFVKLQGLF